MAEKNPCVTNRAATCNSDRNTELKLDSRRRRFTGCDSVNQGVRGETRGSRCVHIQFACLDQPAPVQAEVPSNVQRGVVLKPDGAPLVGDRVYLGAISSKTSNDILIGKTRTDRSGRFALPIPSTK